MRPSVHDFPILSSICIASLISMPRFNAEGKSNEFVLHACNDVFDIVGDLNKRWQNRLTLNNPNFVERYVKAELQVLVHFAIGMIGEQYVALLQGKSRVLGNKRNLIWPIVP